MWEQRRKPLTLAGPLSGHHLRLETLLSSFRKVVPLGAPRKGNIVIQQGPEQLGSPGTFQLQNFKAAEALPLSKVVLQVLSHVPGKEAFARHPKLPTPCSKGRVHAAKGRNASLVSFEQ